LGFLQTPGSDCSRRGVFPAVVNTFQGSAKIKTGNRIKVDGTEAVVYILD
jgi:hypothetical protein